MNSNPENHVPEVHNVPAIIGGQTALLNASLLKFEQSEIREFEQADANAGRMIGRLLALLFFVSVVLMAGVNYWMIENAANGTDPQAPIVPGSATPSPAHK